jgi:photosystem II stability/assembly factor-like uncharacterized protein
MKRQLLSFLSALIVGNLGLSSAAAQWQQTAGPYGGITSSFVTTQDGYLAVTGQDLYRYKNGEWSLHTKDWYGQLMRTEDVILAAHVTKAKRSTDNGATWQDTKLPSDHVLTLETSFLSQSSDSLFTSPDGANWTFRAELPIEPVGLVEHDGRLYVFSGWNGLMRSDDTGRSWQLLQNQPPFQITMKWASTDGALYAMPYPSGIYRTTDHGETWEAMNKDLYEGTIFEGAAQHGNDIFVSDWLTTYRLVNDKWEEMPIAQINAMQIVDGKLVMATDAGLATYDNGKLTSLAGGVIARDVTKMASVGNTLFAKTATGLYRTQDGGATWELNRNTYAEDIAVAKGSILVRGTSILRSTDEGNTWQNLDPIFEQFIVHPTKLAAIDGNLYLTSGFQFAGEHGSGAGWTVGGVYVSMDGGEIWYDISTNLPHNGVTHVPVYNILGANGRLLIQTAEGLFVRQEGSQSWGRVFPNVETRNAVLFSAGDVFMMMADSAWYVSSNGDYWEPLIASAPADFMRNYEYVHDFSMIGNVPYVTTARYVKIDSTHYTTHYRNFKLESNCWIDVTGEMPANTVSTSFVEHQGDLYAATQTIGVWKRDLPAANVAANDAESLPLYPNPATDVIYVEGEHAQVFDALGREMTAMVRVVGEGLNVSLLPAGHYTIRTSEGTASFVKQ